MKCKKVVIYVVLGVVLLVLGLYLVRAFSDRYLDDVSPEIPCEMELLEKADVFYVIPKFNNKSISDDRDWCNNIMGLGKKLQLHGVYHTFKEFDEDRNDRYLQEGIDIFRNCFRKYPGEFKPPQLEISNNNRKLVKRFGLKLIDSHWFHKAYHCDDTGVFSNRFIDWF